MSKDSLGDRMKLYEAAPTPQLLPLLPILCRVDGRSFHNFTKGMPVPFPALHECMVDAARTVAKESNARCAYVQSDEATFLWYSDDIKSQVWFDGKYNKMVSQSASIFTLAFYKKCQELIPEYLKKSPTFDARVWQVPNLEEAVNVFIWRHQDAVRNSINMLAGKHFSHKTLMGKSIKERLELMKNASIEWEDEIDSFKYGTFIRREKIIRNDVERKTLVTTYISSLTSLENRVGFIVHGEQPIYEQVESNIR
jgi:tRNA(His) guanylyltransferase